MVISIRIVNQSSHEETDINPIDLPVITPKKSSDDLLLLDLDPFGSTNNHEDHNTNHENKLESIKHDLEELYAAIPSAIQSEAVSTPTILPDIIGQQEDLPSISLPLLVEQLENEVREEILQHTLEQPSSSLLLPDLTTLSNGNHDEQNEPILLSTSIDDEEENLLLTPIIETTNNFIFQKEPDLIQHETTTASTEGAVVLHSVDSIVNLPTVTNHEVQISSVYSKCIHSNKNIFVIDFHRPESHIGGQ